jgi:hypothetical protein
MLRKVVLVMTLSYLYPMLRLLMLRSSWLKVLVLTFASIFMVDFYRIVAMAVEQYQRIEDETLRPFSSARESEPLLRRKGEFQSRWPITGFKNRLEAQILKKRRNLLNTVSSGFSPEAMERLIAGVSDVSFNMSSRRLCGGCPFCSAESTELIKDLEERNLWCSEYVLRKQRIAEFIAIEDCTHHPKLHTDELRQEHDKLMRLCGTIHERLDHNFGMEVPLGRVLCGPLEQLESMVPTLRSRGAHVLYYGEDCFNRHGAHRWLDSVDQDLSDDDWPTTLMRYGTRTMEHLNEQDWFGRTPLHITCQKRWPRATRLLLDMGADPSKSTKFSSFPIHYAAANGSKLICEMLLAHKVKFNIHGTDSNGLTARDYAIGNGCTEVAKLLFEYCGIGKCNGSGLVRTTL